MGDSTAVAFATTKLSSTTYRITLSTEHVTFHFLPVKHSIENDFGLVIAYLVPGALTLWGAGYLFPPIRSWFGATTESGPSVGGFLFVTLGAIGAGLLVSAIRWAVVDKAYHLTGIPEPRWNFSRLPGRLHAFEGLVDNHFRYFQSYANSMVALTFVFLARLVTRGLSGQGIMLSVVFLAIIALLILASRDALRKYYSRAEMVLRSSPSR